MARAKLFELLNIREWLTVMPENTLPLLNALPRNHGFSASVLAILPAILPTIDRPAFYCALRHPAHQTGAASIRPRTPSTGRRCTNVDQTLCFYTKGLVSSVFMLRSSENERYCAWLAQIQDRKISTVQRVRPFSRRNYAATVSKTKPASTQSAENH